MDDSSSGGASRPENATSGVALQVELYSLLAGAAVMLGFGFLGLLANLGLLVSVRCMAPAATRGAHGVAPPLYYALPFCLALLNVLFALLWVPLDVMRLLLNYNGVAIESTACYADVALFVFCVTTTVLVVLFFALQRCTKHYSIEISHGTFVSTAIVVSLVLGVLASGSSVTTYSASLDYQLCVQRAPVEMPTLYQGFPVIGVLTFLVLLLVVAILLFCNILWRQRCRLSVVRRTRCRHNRKMSDAAALREASQEAAERFLDPESDLPSAAPPPEARSSRKSSKTSQLLCIKDNNDDTDKKGDDEDAEDDDFDQKMKLRLQKSLSGRRHTVANISLGLSSLNKTSSQDSVNRSPSPFNYQYVRKWSVDIQALQDQLENPKGLLGANPFAGLGGSFKRERHEPSDHSIEEKPEHEEIEEETAQSTSEPQSDPAPKAKETMFKEKRLPKKVDRTKSDQSGMKSKDTQPMGVKFDTVVKTSSDVKSDKGMMSSSGSEVRFSDTIEEHDAEDVIEQDEEQEQEEQRKCDNEVKNVCIQECTKDSIIEEDENEPDGILSFPEPDSKKPDRQTQDEAAAAVAAGRASAADAELATDSDLELLTIQRIKDITQQMQTNSVVLLLLLIVISCIVPYSALQLFQWSMSRSFNRNLSWMLAALVLVQMPLHVLLLAWMERPLWKALRRLWVKLTHWRCVCYCNIGKGKDCFQRPGYRETSPAV